MFVWHCYLKKWCNNSILDIGLKCAVQVRGASRHPCSSENSVRCSNLRPPVLHLAFDVPFGVTVSDYTQLYRYLADFGWCALVSETRVASVYSRLLLGLLLSAFEPQRVIQILRSSANRIQPFVSCRPCSTAIVPPSVFSSSSMDCNRSWQHRQVSL